MEHAFAGARKRDQRRRSPALVRALGWVAAACFAAPASFAAAVPEATAAEAAARADALIATYIDRWRNFYPSQAFANGDLDSAARFEDFSDERVGQWLDFNARTLTEARALHNGESLQDDLAIDLAHLIGQADHEQSEWREDRYLDTQPQWYAEHVSHALTHLLVRDQLSPEERSSAIINRLRGVALLCRQAQAHLTGGNAERTRLAIRTLAGTRNFYQGSLRTLVADWPQRDAIVEAATEAANAVAELQRHLQETILPAAEEPIGIGEQIYGAKLKRRSRGSFGPQDLLAAAYGEIQDVRNLMIAEARRWRDAQGQSSVYPGKEDVLSLAIEAMESQRQNNGADFLEEFRSLTFAAEDFVREHQLATIPEPTTLYVNLSPAHFSGAAVGGVYPSGPFAPNANTLFYVPSVPPTAPQTVRDGFYRSFNTHFNTMIISHEMFPGHYLQYKVAVREAPAIRSLFPNGAYVEGWGSFVEELMLDAGWADNAPLTRLAHLRKRLENATRAYVSVQVHTADWGEDEVLRFAVEEGLLAPQFAVNLWQRVVHTPLQITDYFRGYHRFKALYEAKPPAQSTRDWVDAVLRSGPLPMTMLEQVLSPAASVTLTSP